MNSKPSKSWKKGIKSPNPNGRPVQPWRKVFEMETEKLVATKDGKQKIKHLMAKAQIGEALKGDTGAFNAVADRMEGRPAQDITTGGEKIDNNIHIWIPDKLPIDDK